MEQKIDTATPGFTVEKFTWQLLCEYARGAERLSGGEANLNELCPSVKPMKVEEFLKTWWGTAEA